jgi:hypothetical protein
MAKGVNPLLDELPTTVVQTTTLSFTVPEARATQPIQFEMRIDLDYAQCDPNVNGPQAEQACRDQMQQELVNALGAPSDMVQVVGVRPG